MLGASRDSLARQSDALDARRQEADFGALAGELFAIANLLGEELQLRNALADSGQLTQVRSGLVQDVFGARVSGLAVEVLRGVVTERWSNDQDLVMAIEALAAQACFTVAEADGTLDATEEELFRFGRTLDQSPELQMALTAPAQPAATKAAIVRDLLSGRSTAATQQVLEYSVGHLHGRRIDSVVDGLVDLAARQRDRVVAEVRVAAPMDATQERRLADVLSRLKGRTVRLNIAVDPSVLGGAYVKVGDEVIDGTISAKLEQARRVVLG